MTFIFLEQQFSWNDLLFGEHGSSFLLETVLRSAIMFLVLLCSLRILGKRGVKQLSIFELVVIIGLGSAAGDPMFYKDVGIITASCVFIVIILLYSIITFLVAKSPLVEKLIEGQPICLLEEGKFCIKNYNKEWLGDDEFFSELRLKGISHLGQVKLGIIETCGDISIFYYPDEEVRYGLPILPAQFEAKIKAIAAPGIYSCAFCGHTEEVVSTGEKECMVCKRKEWVKSSKEKRIT